MVIAILAIGGISAYLFMNGISIGNTDDGKTSDAYSDDEINDLLGAYNIDPDSELANTIALELKELTQTYNDKKGVIYANIEKLVSESKVDDSKVVLGPLRDGYKKSRSDSYVVYWIEVYALVERQMLDEKNNSDSDLWTKDFPQWSDMLRNSGIPLNAYTFDTILKWVLVDSEEYPEAYLADTIVSLGRRHTPDGWDREFLEQFDDVHSSKKYFNVLDDYEYQQEIVESFLTKFLNQCPSDIKEDLSEKIDEVKQLIKEYYEDVTETIHGNINKSKV